MVQQDIAQERFHRLLPASATSNLNVLMVGAGAIGSRLGIELAKLGVRNFVIYDNDAVEVENVGVQAFDYRDIGTNKAIALRERMLHQTKEPPTVTVRQRFFTEKTIIPARINVVISAVDNVDARINLINACLRSKSKNSKFYMDGRMGALSCELWCGEFAGGERPLDVDKYITSLTDKEFKPAPCGQKAVPYTAAMLSAIMANQLRKWTLGHAIIPWQLHNLDAGMYLNSDTTRPSKKRRQECMSGM